MTKPLLRNFHNGVSGSVIYVRLSVAKQAQIKSVLSSGLMEVGLPDPANTAHLLTFLASVLDVPAARLEIAGDSINSENGQTEKMVAIIGLDAPTADERILRYYKTEGKA